ncbi:polysaccharide lyase [Desulforhopalus singaporensis]|uniref:Polysaccharide lyase n=1 Tax=Desulforhopalus singaporensis TaxID=91360 RepID=A0A1H0UYK0_9BACT|nr:polysaccharide lyase [Desulforhopalus singaporensis]SDP71191.1 Polysaccharide lyase [Desulforhopalus singaporensis]
MVDLNWNKLRVTGTLLVLLSSFSVAKATICDVDKTPESPPLMTSSLLIGDIGNGPNFKHDYTELNPLGIDAEFEGATSIDSYSWLSTKRFTHPYSAEISNQYARCGNQSLKVELHPGNKASNGWRSEARDKNHAVQGSEVWYAISVYLPAWSYFDGVRAENFPSFDPRPDKDSTNYYVLNQFHDQKVLPTEVVRKSSPPLALRYKQGQLYLTLMNQAIYEDYRRRGTDGDGVVIWKSDHSESLKDQWLDLVYQIRWSHKEQKINVTDPGFVRVWMNGKLLVECHGDIGYNDRYGTYFKFGVYAKRNIAGPRVAFFDRYLRGVKHIGSTDVFSQQYRKIVRALQFQLSGNIPYLDDNSNEDLGPLRVRCESLKD